jgi:hypothetical protein
MATQEDIANLADLVFLSQNTGVSSGLVKAAYEKVGVDSGDSFAFVEANKILSENGYSPGNNKTFYGDNSASDIGAKLLSERWQLAPSEEKLAEDGVRLVNDNGANNAWLTRELYNRGIGASETSAIIGTSINEVTSRYAETEKLLKDNSFWGDLITSAGSYDAATSNMLEWDKKEEEVEDIFKPVASAGESAVARVQAPLPEGTIPAGQPVAATAIPQNITQEVTQPNYNSTGFSATNIGDARSGGFGKPLQTAGLSAIPQTTSYKTQYAGTPGLVDPTLLAPTGGSGTGSQQVRYYNPNTKQELMVTVFNDVPVTYVPPGFIPKPDKEVIGAAEGGYMQGYAEGGSADKMLEAKFRIASMNGYSGPKTNSSLNAYANASPAMTAKFNAIGATMNQGGMVQSFDEGGVAGHAHPHEGWNTATQPAYAIGDTRTSTGGGFGGFQKKYWTYDGTKWVKSEDYAKALEETKAAETQAEADQFEAMKKSLVNQTMQPMQSTVQSITPTANQFTPVDAGQTLPIAPYAEAATVGTVQQAELPTATPTFASFTPSGVAADVAKAVEGGRTLRSEELLAAATTGKSYIGGESPHWDEAKGKYVQGGVETAYQEFTPEEFAAQNNLNIGDFQTTYGSLQAAQGTVTKGEGSAAQTKFDEDGRPISSVSALPSASGTFGVKDPVTGLYDTSGIEGKEIFKEATNDYKRKLVTNAVTGDIEITGTELIKASANALTASIFTEAIQKATASPTAKATVAGQLAILMKNFEGGNTPAWAAGSMRAAAATMAARGLGASSMAGQAVIQATMEAALPIAQMDAQVQAQFESQNLSNRQARAMLSAQQRAAFMGQEFDQGFQARVQNAAKISDIANMNFTADQTIQLENSRNAQTLSLTNLSNSQAMVMAEASALASLDSQNLNNRQQTAVQNSQNFLAMDMANLNNNQQTAMFKTQQNVQSLFTDQAAENASKQFNASSENQTNQFFENLRGQTSQFNASQQNAMDQFNVNSVNALREFNSEIQQQRDMFNAQNGLVIAQSNAQWRQSLDTLNTTALNDSNREFAATMNGLTAGNLEQIWQRERDIMDYAYKISASSKDRALSIMLADKKYEEYSKAREDADETSMWSFLTETVFDIKKITDAVK